MRTCTTFEGSFFSCYTIVQRKVPLTAEDRRVGRLLADEGLREALRARLALHRVGLALKPTKMLFMSGTILYVSIFIGENIPSGPTGIFPGDRSVLVQ